MTPDAHRSHEYIIDEGMVQCIEAWTSKYPEVSKDIAKAIRSRPHDTHATSAALKEMLGKIFDKLEAKADR